MCVLVKGIYLTVSRLHADRVTRARRCLPSGMLLCRGLSFIRKALLHRGGSQAEPRKAGSRSTDVQEDNRDLNQTMRQLSFKHSSVQSAFGFPSSPLGSLKLGTAQGFPLATAQLCELAGF